MKAVKTLVIATAAAAVIMPAQAQDLQPREVAGIVVGAIIGYELMKERNEPRVIVQQPQPVIVVEQRRPHCYLRQAYSAPGQGAVYVQECRY